MSWHWEVTAIGKRFSLRLWKGCLEKDARDDARLGLFPQPAGLFGVRSCFNKAQLRVRLLLVDLRDVNITACLVLPPGPGV